MNRTKSNQHIFQKIDNIHPPQIKLIELRNFDLSLIPAYFRIADFERFKSDYHVKKIITAIRQNRLYNVVFTAYKDSKKQYVVNDGQHRLAALYCLHRDYGLKNYDIIVVEVPQQEAIDVYRNNNVGKRLTMANHLKGIEAKRIFNPFFNGLKDILCHDDGSKLLSYAQVLECHYYATTGLKNLNISTLEHALTGVTKEDIDFIRTYYRGLVATMPTKAKGLQFRPMFMKCTFSAAYAAKLNQLEICKLIEWGLKQKSITDDLDKHAKSVYEQITRLFITEAFKNSGGVAP